MEGEPLTVVVIYGLVFDGLSSAASGPLLLPYSPTVLQSYSPTVHGMELVNYS